MILFWQLNYHLPIKVSILFYLLQRIERVKKKFAQNLVPLDKERFDDEIFTGKRNSNTIDQTSDVIKFFKTSQFSLEKR